jgi:hypothetical protein
MIYHFLKKKELFVKVFARVAWTPLGRDASTTNTGYMDVADLAQIHVAGQVLFQDFNMGVLMYHQGRTVEWVHGWQHKRGRLIDDNFCSLFIHGP